VYGRPVVTGVAPPAASDGAAAGCEGQGARRGL